MDFAIAPVRRAAGPPGAVPRATPPEPEWVVLWLYERCGVEVAQQLAHFGHRLHAEAFLADLLTGRASRGAAAAGDGWQ